MTGDVLLTGCRDMDEGYTDPARERVFFEALVTSSTTCKVRVIYMLYYIYIYML